MTIPKSITIAGRKMEIVKCDSLDLFGEYKHDQGRIIIGKCALESTDKTIMETIRHEALEASLHMGGLAWSENYNQESVVRCIENLFFPAWDGFLKQLTKLNK